MPNRFAALSLVMLLACSEDETAPIDTGPDGPPSIVFADPPSGDAPACGSIGDEVDARVPLVVDTEQLVLRPPGACGQLTQCGHLALFLGNALNNESPVRAIDLLLGKLADRYHDGSTHPGTGEPDLLHVRVAVVDDAGNIRQDHQKQDLVDELDLMTLPECCTNLASSAVASSSGGAGEPMGFVPAKWNDGVTGTECQAAACGVCQGWVDSTTEASGAWAQYDWAEPVTIGSIWIDTNACNSPCYGGGRALKSGQVQYWDGSDWVSATTFNDQVDDFGVSFVPRITTTRLRIYDITTGTCGAGNNALMYEWYVYPGSRCSP
jgi:hypothetical protein